MSNEVFSKLSAIENEIDVSIKDATEKIKTLQAERKRLVAIKKAMVQDGLSSKTVKEAVDLVKTEKNSK